MSTYVKLPVAVTAAESEAEAEAAAATLSTVTAKQNKKMFSGITAHIAMYA